MTGEGRSGWRPLRELSLRRGDILAFRYNEYPEYTAAVLEGDPSGGCGRVCEERVGRVHEFVGMFSSPEEIALEMEARGNPGRVLLLNFVPRYRAIRERGTASSFPDSLEGEAMWMEIG